MVGTSRPQEVLVGKQEKVTKVKTAYDAMQVGWLEWTGRYRQLSGMLVGCSQVSVW